jgi:hypothetical protein
MTVCAPLVQCSVLAALISVPARMARRATGGPPNGRARRSRRASGGAGAFLILSKGNFGNLAGLGTTPVVKP